MNAVDKNQLIAMLRGAVAQVRANHEWLSKLDSCGGDGDHGTTMLRAMTAVDTTAGGSTAATIGALLQEIGWAVMGVDGGATGPLFGSFFSGMSDPAGDRASIDAATLAAMFEGGLATVQKRTKAKLGDKTMIDALVPAVQAARAAADAGGDVNSVLAQAAAAARAGAESTQQLQARFGRAKNVGAKSIGTQDAGATSVSLVFQGFADGLNG